MSSADVVSDVYNTLTVLRLLKKSYTVPDFRDGSWITCWNCIKKT